jgi:hypothetical protein
MICPEQSRSQLPIISRREQEWPFWRAEARSGKGELLPILLDNTRTFAAMFEQVEVSCLISDDIAVELWT